MLVEIRTTAIMKTDLEDVEEQVVKSVDAVGRQVTGEIDRLIRVVDAPRRPGPK